MSDTRSLIVKCPNCGVDVIWIEQNIERPFCSVPCRDSDFISWAKEDHKIGGDNDDLLAEDWQEN